ncbi:MAG: alkaline phosphatase family protein [Candidatus Aminicenantes bacterium]|nr:alkaline phosphatase family protein [Candidatus Aminicenantes bacterium]
MNRSLFTLPAHAIILLMIPMIFGWAWPTEVTVAQTAQMSALETNPEEDGIVPNFSHVIVIIFENKEFDQVIGNSQMPRFNGLSKQHTLLTGYYAITHPSLPNYLALVSGDTFGIETDCTDCFVNARSLPDLLEAGGRTWKTYQEGLPRAGFKGSSSGRYAIKHNPFLYFDAIRNDQTRCKRSVVPLRQLDIDLKEGHLPDFSFIVPDLCNSSHDCDLKVTDAWLGRVVDSILNSPAFDQNSLLVITFDEGTSNEGCCGPSPLSKGGRVATVLISPLVKKGFENSTAYSHYSLLKTISAVWKLEELGHASDPATNLIVLPWQSRKLQN